MTMLGIASSSGRAIAGAAPREVVSYLLYVETAPHEMDLPDREGPTLRTPPESWQWRFFDPVTMRDTLFLTLRTFPNLIRWNSRFNEVEFLLGDRIERVAWRLGAKLHEEAALPIDSSVCDFWSSVPGTWHAILQHEVALPAPPGNSRLIQVATRWDLGRERVWSPAVVDTSDDDYGNCFTTERLEKGAPRPPNVPIQALLDSMRIGNYQDSVLSIDSDRDPDGFDGLVWIAFRKDRTVGIETRAGQGDTYHAFAPVTWVDRVHSRRAVVYPVDDREGADDQVAFAARGDFLLISSEYEGAYPVVVNLETGKILKKADRLSARAVWVPAPDGWR